MKRRLELFACDRLGARLTRGACSDRSVLGDALYISKEGIYAPSEWSGYAICKDCGIGQAHARELGKTVQIVSPKWVPSKEKKRPAPPARAIVVLGVVVTEVTDLTRPRTRTPTRSRGRC